MARVEKLCKGTGSKARRFHRYLKNQTARLRRRLWKLLGEDAPVRVRELTRGWSD
ncbi:MAG TPA: hypothetical protein VFB71_02905 [Ramlibacter sp.]|nr:hypothetical protein [Ramlibacter sp.]